MSKLQLKITYADGPGKLVDFLAAQTQLSKMKIKGVLDAGGVWITLSKGKKKRTRRASLILKPGDKIEFNYDPRIDFKAIPTITPHFQRHHWGVWYKPANVLSCGGPFGDRGCVLDQVEKQTGHHPYLVHRLDRETAGLIIVAYSATAQRKLSELFQSAKIEKTYHALVKGLLSEPVNITKKLAGKKAVTHVKPIRSDEQTTLVEVQIETGRIHQIRRHLDMIKHPVMGDPKYGRHNSDPKGLRLVATALKFQDPFDQQIHHFELPSQQWID